MSIKEYYDKQRLGISAEDIAFTVTALFSGCNHTLRNVTHVNEIISAEIHCYREKSLEIKIEHRADARRVVVIVRSDAAARMNDAYLQIIVCTVKHVLRCCSL